MTLSRTNEDEIIAESVIIPLYFEQMQLLAFPATGAPADPDPTKPNSMIIGFADPKPVGALIRVEDDLNPGDSISIRRTGVPTRSGPEDQGVGELQSHSDSCNNAAGAASGSRSLSDAEHVSHSRGGFPRRETAPRRPRRAAQGVFGAGSKRPTVLIVAGEGHGHMLHDALHPLLAIVPVRDADSKHVLTLIRDLQAQEGVDVDILIVDQTVTGRLTGELAKEEVRIVRELSPSRGAAWRHALRDDSRHDSAGDADDWCAWCLPGTRLAPDRLTTQVRAATRRAGSVDMITSDLSVVESADYTRRLAVDLGSDPPALWEAGVLLRREVLQALGTVCFWPVELELLREMAAAGRVSHVPAALVSVDGERHRVATEYARHDAELLRLARHPHAGPPEVSVILATHERADVLLECLEAYSRQLLPPGTFEILVIDDGSTDGTVEVGQALELPVPFTFLHKEADGASRARIFGMPHASGRLLLFANDDTIPFANNVQTHLEAHRELAGRKAMVLGTFEQPTEHLENALMRLLERTHYVFNYASWSPGEELDASAFYTCHLSVPRAAVEEVGGFDADFSHYGCEDTDLGVRLEDAGWTIHYRPECRALHRHLLDFDSLKRRQPLVARAHTRLFLKHPRLLAGHNWSDHGNGRSTEQFRTIGRHLPTIEAAARTLADVNLAHLERAGEACAATAETLSTLLKDLFGKVNKIWWDRGLVEGCELHGLSGLSDALARWSPDLPKLAGNAVLLSAMGSDWPVLAAGWLALHGTDRGQTSQGELLTVLVDPAHGPDFEGVKRLLCPIVARARRNGHVAPVALAPATSPSQRERLYRSARAWIPIGPTTCPVKAPDGVPVLDVRARLVGPTHWPLDTVKPLRVLAWPHWDRPESFRAIASAVVPLAGREDVCLVLRAEPGDLPPDTGLALLDKALRRLDAPNPELQVLIEAAPMAAANTSGFHEDWMRLTGSIDALIVPVEEDQDVAKFLRALGRCVLVTANDTRLWLADRERAEPVQIPVLREEVCHA